MNATNVHNFGLLSAQTRQIGEHLHEQQVRDAQDPLHSCAFALGDMNCMTNGERRYKAGLPVQLSHNANQTGTIYRGKWLKIFEHWTEISQPMPTCHNVAHDASSRVDRGWTTASSACLLNMTVSSAVAQNPELMVSDELSDHAVVDFTFRLFVQSSQFQKPIPTFICKIDSFKE